MTRTPAEHASLLRTRVTHALAAMLLPLVLSACGDGADSASATAGSGTDVGQGATRAEPLAVATPAQASWSARINLPIVPVSAANLPNGKILLWSAEDRFGFGNDLGRTYATTFDPSNNTATERLVSETGHDMFCTGTTNLADGRLLINGGISSARTSLFDGNSGTWSTGTAMNIPRGYHANTITQDGSVLTLGGSWSGGSGNKHGEVWSQAGGWRRLSGVPIDPFLSPETSRPSFAPDSHFWLVPAGNGKVFHPGPGVNMYWIDTLGNGRVVPAGRRGDDEFSINGNTVMYDTGKILKTGGAPQYTDIGQANTNSYIIDLNAGVSVRKIQPMAYRRAYHNSVVLPNGQVVIIGGQTNPVGFSDSNSVLVPEIFDPATERFTTMPAMAVPRNYHSVALLLPDGRVLSAGGGLCGAGCAANHADAQILTPNYLLKPDGTPAVRPVITSAPAQAVYGTTMTVTTDSAVSSFAIVRLSSTTHTVNNDQRRLALSFRASGTTSYAVDVPTNPGWALPGYYMLFAMNGDGTPSIARIMRIGGDNAPTITPVDDQSGSVGGSVRLALQAAAPSGTSVTYFGSGLPDGVSLDPGTGVIQGTPSRNGTYTVHVGATNGVGRVTTQFQWTVSDPGNVRFVKFEALGEVNNNPWTSMAEFYLLDEAGQTLPRAGWTVTADSQELVNEPGGAANAIDGNLSTIWHTQWATANPPHPHWLTINLGGAQRVGGFRYVPRSGGGNGTVAAFRFYTSSDGVNWGQPIAQGDLRNFGANAEEKVVYLNNLVRGKPVVQSSTYDVAAATRAADGNVDGNYGAGSVSHTLANPNEWWEVDLGSLQSLHTVRIWNRTDCCSERLTDFHVFVSSQPMQGRTLAALLADTAVQRVRYSAAPGRVTTLPVSATGRYLRVQLAGTNHLQLAEVEAFGRVAVNRPPTLATPPAQSTQQGSFASLQLAGSDQDADALTYAASGLPAGLNINTASGLISGTPAAAGSYPVTATVSDGRGGSATVNFTWSVVATTPVIQPIVVPQATPGSTATYTVNAGAGGFQYSWNWGDGTPASGFSSSNSATHSFAAAGVYSINVTVRAGDGTTTTKTILQPVIASTARGVTRTSANVIVESRGGLNDRVWAVNQDNDSVTVFDAGTNTRLREIAVGSGPRTLTRAADGRIWVANKLAGSLSVIDPASLAVVQTIALPRGSQPYGVVSGNDGHQFVTLEATGRLLKVNGSGQIVANVAATGARHVSISLDGGRLLVTRFVTGAQPGEGTATVQTTISGVPTGGEVAEFDPVTLTKRRTVVLRHSDKQDTTISGRGVPNYLGAAAFSPDGSAAWVPSKQDNVRRGALRDGLPLDFQNTVRAVSSRIDLSANAEDYPARVDHDNSGVASAAAYHPSGAFVFVALEASRQVAVIDPFGKRELFRIEAGRAPQGVALSPDGLKLFVHNFMDRTVGAYDLQPLMKNGEGTARLAATLQGVSVERLAANVLRGKQFFYDGRDPRLARDAYLSCAACHNDGGQDGRTWDFTGFGEGLRNTISLRGRAGAQGRLHWSANFDEVQDFEGQIRGFAQGTGLMTDAQFNTGTRNQPLGDRKAGVSADLDALAAYVSSLTTFEVSPERNANGTLTAQAASGRAIFATQCASCHGGQDFTDSAAGALRNIGTIKSASGKRLGSALTGIDTPTLRDVWATAPYLHDGSAATVEDAIRAHAGITLGATDLAAVAAFTRQIGREEPAVAPVTTKGLRGEYFANPTLAGTPALVRNEAIDFYWEDSPAPGLPADDFSVRWTGTLVIPTTGNYRFRTHSDDGVRVWINGQLLINNWTDHAATFDETGIIPFTAGQRVSVKIEFYEAGWSALMRFQWRTPGVVDYVAVPVASLEPQ